MAKLVEPLVDLELRSRHINCPGLLEYSSGAVSKMEGLILGPDGPSFVKRKALRPGIDWIRSLTARKIFGIWEMSFNSVMVISGLDGRWPSWRLCRWGGGGGGGGGGEEWGPRSDPLPGRTLISWAADSRTSRNPGSALDPRNKEGRRSRNEIGAREEIIEEEGPDDGEECDWGGLGQKRRIKDDPTFELPLEERSPGVVEDEGPESCWLWWWCCW